MVYDKSILRKLGSKATVESTINAALAHMQVSYCLDSFPMKVDIERDGGFISYPRNINADERNILNLAGFTKQNLGNANLLVYLCDNNGDRIGGIAPTSKKHQSEITYFQK